MNKIIGIAIIAIVVAVGVGSIALYGISSGGSTVDTVDKPIVISSFYPIYEFTNEVGGTKIDSSLLIPPGAEPHDWEPTIRDVQRLQAADLVVINGIGFETWVEDLEEGEFEGTIVDTSVGITIMGGGHEDDHDEEKDDHDDERDEHGDDHDEEKDDHDDERDEHGDDHDEEKDDHDDERDEHGDDHDEEKDDHDDERDEHGDDHDEEKDDHDDERDEHGDDHDEEKDDHDDERDEHGDDHDEEKDDHDDERDEHGDDHDEEKDDHDDERHEDDHSDPHDHSAGDPHIWLSPVLAQIQVQNIADALSDHDPANREYYQTRAEQYNAKLANLDDNIRKTLANCNDDFIAFHKAFSYFAEEYDLTQHNVIATIDPHGEVTGQTLENVITTAKRLNIDVIFTDEQSSKRTSQVIADDIGGQVLVLSPLEINSDQDYISRMSSNLQNLEVALCR